MSKESRHPNEIENVARAIRAREFPRLLNFTDMVNRYVAIQLRDKVGSWLKNSALYFLITRGGSLTPSELARLMFRSKHYMTKLIDSLEKDGLVIRERVSKDRRTINVKITSDGVDYVMQTLRDNDWMEEEVMSCLDNSEIETLRTLLKKLRQRLVEKVGDTSSTQ